MATKQILLGVSDSIASGIGNLSSLPIQFLANDENTSFRRSTECPVGYSAISAITLRVVRRTTGDLYLRFVAGHTAKATSSALTEDSTAFTAYAVSGTAGEVFNITVPAGTYNALTLMTYGDLFSIGVQRDATNALDTYEDDLEVIGFLVEFTVGSVSAGTVSPNTNAIITLDTVKDYLSIPLLTATDDDFLQLAINEASQEIEDYVQNKVVVQTITDEIYDGDGTYKLWTNYYPIVSLGALGADSAAQLAAVRVRDDVDDTFAAVETDINHIIIDSRKPYILLYEEIFPYGRQTVKITYRAGYSTIPTEFTEGCLMLVVEKYKQSSRGGGRFGKESDSGSGMAVNVSTRYIDIRKKVYELISSYRKYC